MSGERFDLRKANERRLLLERLQTVRAGVIEEIGHLDGQPKTKASQFERAILTETVAGLDRVVADNAE